MAAPDRQGENGGGDIVRVDVLRNFPAVVQQLGGDPRALLAKVRIDPETLNQRHAVLPYRAFVRLLELAALELNCPGFGMRLATVQEGPRILGPLEVAMRHSPTLRAAYDYSAAHMQVFSTAVQFHVEEDPVRGTAYFHFTFRMPEAQQCPQAIEHALMMINLTMLDLSDGKVRAQEIWCTHDPISPLAAYEGYFGAPVKFGQPGNGVFLPLAALDYEIPGCNPLLYELADTYIEQHYPRDELELSARVGAIIEQLLQEGRCSHNEVAAALGMHPRTLQRRLKAIGESFEGIRDAARRDIAYRALKHSDLPLVRITQMLGYSDASMLTRSCYRWFNASPRQIRAGGES
jgi:AraC-like DNA-binding protein